MDEMTLLQWYHAEYLDNIRASIEPTGEEVSVYNSRIVVHVHTEDAGSHPGVLLHNRIESGCSGELQPTYAEKWAYHEN
jgi:hypothetical protein